MERQAASPSDPPAGARALGAAIAVAAAAGMAAWAWNADVPDPAAHRLFLVVWALGGLLIAGDVLGRGVRLPAGVPSAGLVLYLGLLAGTALGTTSWGRLDAGFWYQLWWTPPIATALVQTAWRQYRRRRSRTGEEPVTAAGRSGA